MRTPNDLLQAAQEEYRGLTGGKDCPLPATGVTVMQRLSIVQGRVIEIRTAKSVFVATTATPAPTRPAIPAPAPQNKAARAAAEHAESARLEEVETATLAAKQKSLLAEYKKLHNPALKESFRLANWEGLGLGKRRG